MTANQINYQRHLEQRRTNLKNEELTGKRDSETARANQAREAETFRSNLARELETNRSNVVRETETERANRAKEAEENRSNLARELETNRANLASEQLRKYDTDEKVKASNYSADKSYAGRVDSAYISKYGISKSDAGEIVDAIGETIAKPETAKVAKTFASLVSSAAADTILGTGSKGYKTVKNAISQAVNPSVKGKRVQPVKLENPSMYSSHGGGSRH